MKQFTKEQLNALSQWEDRLYTASVSKFYRNISSKSLETIKAVYEEVSDDPVQANWNCNHCVLAFLAKVGKKYFEDKKALEEKAAQLVNALDEVFDKVSDELEPTKVEKHVVKKTNKRASKKK